MLRRIVVGGLAVALLTVFVGVAVLAVWPVVADAPWEDTGTVSNETDEIRCKAALDMRDWAAKEGLSLAGHGYYAVGREKQRMVQQAASTAASEIRRFC